MYGLIGKMNAVSGVVQNAISRAKPMIAGFGEHFETKPVGGHGITAD